MEATAGLNRICQEAGICDSEAILRTAGIKHAAELFKEDSPRRIRVVCWEDGKVTSCVVEVESDGKTKREMCCYTAEDGGEELYYAWQAHLTSPEVGYKVKSIEVEKIATLPPRAEITERITAGADVR